MKPQPAYISVPCSERLPDPSLGEIFIVNCYSDYNEHKSIFEQFGTFNPIAKKFSCESKAIHAVSWLEEKEDVFVLTKEELKDFAEQARRYTINNALDCFDQAGNAVFVMGSTDDFFEDWINTQKP